MSGNNEVPTSMGEISSQTSPNGLSPMMGEVGNRFIFPFENEDDALPFDDDINDPDGLLDVINDCIDQMKQAERSHDADGINGNTVQEIQSGEGGGSLGSFYTLEEQGRIDDSTPVAETAAIQEITDNGNEGLAQLSRVYEDTQVSSTNRRKSTQELRNIQEDHDQECLVASSDNPNEPVSTSQPLMSDTNGTLASQSQPTVSTESDSTSTKKKGRERKKKLHESDDVNDPKVKRAKYAYITRVMQKDEKQRLKHRNDELEVENEKLKGKVAELEENIIEKNKQIDDLKTRLAIAEQHMSVHAAQGGKLIDLDCINQVAMENCKIINMNGKNFLVFPD